MKRTNTNQFGFALIYIKQDGSKTVTAKLPSAKTAKHQGQIAINNKHRSGVERIEILPFKCGSREKTQQILKTRGVWNWNQF